MAGDPTYLLGHDPDELRRLERQAQVLGLQTYGDTDDPSGPWMAAQIVRTLLPVILSTGVATAAEVDIDTLEDRLAHELGEHRAIYKPPVLVGAWARV